MKKIILLATIFLLNSIATLAAESTPSATPTIEAVEKIKNIVKENLQNTEETVTKQASNIGLSGIVKTIGSKSITLETDKDIFQIAISDETIISKDNKDIKTSSIAIGDKLLVIGQQVNNEDVLNAKIVNVLSVIKEEEIVISKAEIATISKIDIKKKTFILTINGVETSYTLSKKNNVKLDEFSDGDTIFGITKKYQGKYSLAKAIKL